MTHVITAFSQTLRDFEAIGAVLKTQALIRMCRGRAKEVGLAAPSL
jgi:hypothetical protein